MDARLVLRQLLRSPPSYRIFLQPSPIITITHQRRYMSLPRVISPAFWAGMIPKAFRKSAHEENKAANTPKAARQPNPATPFIILALLVGSQAIQILWLKRERDHFTRRTEAKIGALREVIESVQRGENVDVEKKLGTGDLEAEREWKEALKEIEDEELLYRSKKMRRAVKKVEQKKQEVAAVDAAAGDAEGEKEVAEDGNIKVETFKGARFY